MVTICNIKDIHPEDYDETWAIVRSYKSTVQGVKQVDALSPSWDLFKKYRNLVQNGTWGEESFKQVYVPQFIQEMTQDEPKKLIEQICRDDREGKNICIFCYCTDEMLCHRSIIAGILQGYGCSVNGVQNDYTMYYDMYMSAMNPAKCHREIIGSMLQDHEQAAFNEETSICFIGGRPKDLCGYNIESYNGFINQFVKQLQKLAENIMTKNPCQKIRWISDGSQGFGQIAFWAVDILKQQHPDWEMENIIYQPYPGQSDRWTEGLFGKTQYKNMLAQADNVSVITKDNRINTYEAASNAMKKGKRKMINDSDLLISLYATDNWMQSSNSICDGMRYAAEKSCDIMQVKYTTNGGALSISGIKMHKNTAGTIQNIQTTTTMEQEEQACI